MLRSFLTVAAVAAFAACSSADTVTTGDASTNTVPDATLATATSAAPVAPSSDPSVTAVVDGGGAGETTLVSDPSVTAVVDGGGAGETTGVSDPSVTAVSGSILIERLWSPANATVEIIGSGGTGTEAVSVDGETADVMSFDVTPGAGFVVRVWVEEEGAHTVCVGDECGRVYTLAPDAETPEEVIAKIEAAIPLVTDYVDHELLFPGWTIEIGGVLSGTGGTTDEGTRTVTVYRNRGRTVDDFVRTIVHEFGHVADAELLDDAERLEYLEIRGIDRATPWRDPAAQGREAWGRQPEEDFAEVMAMIWSGGQWTPRTGELAPVPAGDELERIRTLVFG